MVKKNQKCSESRDFWALSHHWAILGPSLPSWHLAWPILAFWAPFLAQHYCLLVFLKTIFCVFFLNPCHLTHSKSRDLEHRVCTVQHWPSVAHRTQLTAVQSVKDSSLVWLVCLEFLSGKILRRSTPGFHLLAVHCTLYQHIQGMF